MDLPRVAPEARWDIGRAVLPAGVYRHPAAGLLQLRLVRRGSSVAEIDLGAGPRRVFTRPGDLLLSLPDSPTSFRIDDGRELTVLQIRPDEATRLLAAAGGTLADLATLAETPVRDAFAAEICRQLDASPGPTDEVRQWSLGVLMARLLARARGARPVTSAFSLSPRRLASAIAYIDVRLDRGVTVDDLAGRLEVPRRAFARAFRAATGLPPHQFILRRRADRAVELLTRTDAPIAEIALRVGFSHQAHMSRVLRALNGRTPGQIRAAAVVSSRNTSPAPARPRRGGRPA